MFEIRRLTAADAAAFHEIRLEALERHPSAFGTASHEHAAQSIADVAERLENTLGFGGFDADGLCGTLGLAHMHRVKLQHKASVVMVYVAGRARRQGLADALVTHAIDFAAGRFEMLQLTVNATNHPARRLYERHGFMTYGTEPRALKIDGVYHDEVLMYRLID